MLFFMTARCYLFHSLAGVSVREALMGLIKRGPGSRRTDKTGSSIRNFFRSIHCCRYICPALYALPHLIHFSKKISVHHILQVIPSSSTIHPVCKESRIVAVADSHCLSVNVVFCKSFLSRSRYKIVVKCNGLTVAG